MQEPPQIAIAHAASLENYRLAKPYLSWCLPLRLLLSCSAIRCLLALHTPFIYDSPASGNLLWPGQQRYAHCMSCCRLKAAMTPESQQREALYRDSTRCWRSWCWSLALTC